MMPILCEIADVRAAADEVSRSKVSNFHLMGQPHKVNRLHLKGQSQKERLKLWTICRFFMR
jgi:hypothetical protein